MKKIKKFICEKCKNEVSDSQKFCGSCGSHLEPIQDVADYYIVVFDGAGYYVVKSGSKVVGVKVVSKHKELQKALDRATKMNKKRDDGGYGEITKPSDV